MAEDARSPLRTSLQCQICFNPYDKDKHLPMGLHCQHTFCKACMSAYSNQPRVTCPTCREESVVGDIRPNYSLTEILDALCAECKHAARAVWCVHCDSDLCKSCYGKHLQFFRGDVASRVELLIGEINSINETLRDSLKADSERAKAETVVKKIRATCKTYHDAIENIQKELEKKVHGLVDTNIQSFTTWRKTVDTAVTDAKKFVHDTKGQEMMTISDAQVLRVNENCSKFREALKSSKDSCPPIIYYGFQETQAAPQIRCSEIGEVISTISAQEAEEVHQGSRMQRCEIPFDVAVSADGYILVSDQLSGKMKVYDQSCDVCTDLVASMKQMVKPGSK